MTSKKVWEVLADQDAGKTIPELMGENDALIADFYKACDQFIESFDQVIERERVRHDELMRELRRDEE